jgi:pantothenate synthetase
LVYPQTFENDLALIESLGVEELIMPGPDDIYPNRYRFRIESEADIAGRTERRPIV